MERTPTWSLSPEQLRHGLIAAGEALFPALEVVIKHHVATDKLFVIEGDGILPSLIARPMAHEYVAGGQVRAVFLVEPDGGTGRLTFKARSYWVLP